eukprot:TRINITY_DN523_c1_g1_i2.p1 TRINITY_DN523_c1_g1~~TRINITY_DN523_c1_g1_i2.p1  ORF type:complete len:1267 (-),score=327.47 TRINITY_DN523_c1_g1_i2:1792-5592(-)
MTTVEKLLIQGVRSFSPYNRAIIEFYAPLTLIVGPNGAGKTTIIECLKYATTGELPPDSSRGQAFIHDTKIAGEKEVKAQIKLKFKTVNNKVIVCTRSMQLVQKATKQEWKTIESALQTLDSTQNVVSQSYRCAELDKEIPELMGVSKPILQGVIFVHQEEANWPLGDSKGLKERFDSIFASTRYSKALEAIQKQRKELAQQLKEHQLRLEHAETNLQTAQKMRKEIEDTQKTIQSLEEEMEKLSNDIQQRDRTLKSLMRASEEVKETQLQINRLQVTIEQNKKDCISIAKMINEHFSESSLSELMTLKQNFHTELSELETKAKDFEKSRNTLQREKKSIESLIQQSTLEFGKLQSMKEQYDNLKQTRDNLVIKFSKSYKIEINEEPPFTEESITKFNARARDLTKKASDMLINLQQKNKQVDSEKRAIIENLNNEKSRLVIQLNSDKSSISEKSSMLKSIEVDIEKKRSDINKISETEALLKQEMNKLESINKGFNIDDIKNQMKELEVKKVQCNEKIDFLNSLIQKMTLNARLTAELHRISKNKEDAEKLYTQKLTTFDFSIQELLGNKDLSPMVAQKQLQQTLENTKATLSNESKKLDNAKNSLATTKGQRESVEQQLNQANKELNTRQQKLSQLGDVPFTEYTKTIEKEIEDIKNETVKMQSAIIMYKNFIRSAKKKECCPLCERNVDNVDAFIQKLSNTIEKVPGRLAEITEELQQKENLRKDITSLEPHYYAVEKLKTRDIPSINAKLEDLKSKETEFKVFVDELSPQITKLTNEEKKISKLLDQSGELLSTFTEVNKWKKAYEQEKLKLNDIGSDEYSSIDEVTHQINEMLMKSDQLNKQKEELFNEMQTKIESINSLKSNITKLEKMITSFRNLDADIFNSKQRHDTIKSEIESLQPKIEQYQRKLVDIDAKMKTLIEERRAAEEKASKDEQEYSRENQKFLENVLKIEQLNRQISDYDYESIHTKLSGFQQGNQQSESKLAEITKKIEKLTDGIDQIVTTLGSVETKRRNLEDNIRLRTKQAEIEKYTANLAELQQIVREKLSISDSNISDVDRLNKELVKLRSDKDKFEGSRLTHLETIRRRNVDLSSKQYADADEDHRSKLITLHTTDMAHRDLDKYHNALDKALMKYHSLKMTEINQIIKELWQSTYKGNDIESIEIRAESAEGSKKKLYNYRVVMIKGGVPIDMRGRCSAGQKVLASLIIRLALAETFCINCGILALDEPTTNLDRHNVESFAQALVKIVENRKDVAQQVKKY